MELLKLNEDHDACTYFFSEDLNQCPAFQFSINLNEKLHHIESSTEWPQTKCLCLQMTQVFLTFTASSWMVVGGCVRSSYGAGLCSGVPMLIAATKWDIWREKRMF